MQIDDGEEAKSAENHDSNISDMRRQRQKCAIGKYDDDTYTKMPMSNCPFFIKYPAFISLRKRKTMENLKKMKRFVRARRFNLNNRKTSGKSSK